ncbi:MFS transporter [Streptacidiphilus jiangxiensis]|uniref:Major Facilitator Superfamily protein n=1 Tax=Streptacidiphilus jiangxiensis TaxID=235985 RepID=A0A1H7W3J1_STRJI|nr:MFS transporter [Streptacidiphilus jiangxiensis]SEM16103.1 Major Facilitator Superfamily protein [Streptacidiphilus jiangxiensis]
MALSESTPTPAPAEQSAAADAAGSRPTRGLLPLLFAGNSAMYALYVGVGGILLPLQIEKIAPHDKVAMLGLVAGVSAVFATVFNPVAGALSDRSGRRNPWILGGGLLAVPAMLLLGAVNSVLLVAIAWCLGQAVMNVYQAAITSVIPDRVPVARRGTASAAVGLGVPIGSILGVLVANGFSGHFATGYLVLGLIVAAVAVLFTSLTKETRRPPKAPATFGEQVRAFADSLKAHDFRWAFIGRALLVLGYFGVSGYQLYVLQDHISLPHGMSATAAAAILTPVSSVAMVVSIAVCGPLSDKVDRRKLFVGISATASGLAVLIPISSPTFAGMLLFSVVNGLAFGCFFAVDNALVTLVLPKAEDAARDMGVLNVANAGPQIVAPFVASVLVSAGGYNLLFAAGGALAVLGALAIRPIRSVR